MRSPRSCESYIDLVSPTHDTPQRAFEEDTVHDGGQITGDDQVSQLITGPLKPL
jgi:hypothetical protein